MNEVRFWKKVDKTNNCWLWLASKDRDGYGMFGTDIGIRRAHRLSYELVNGPIPTGMVLDHLCRIKHCINPSHLELVTYRENTVRGNTVLNKKSNLPVGVKMSPAGNYIAVKRINGKKQYIGTYKTPEEASDAYIAR